MAIPELVERRADERPEARAYAFLTDGGAGEAWLTRAELARRARAIGGMLQAAGARGAHVLLLFPPGLDYVAALFGCWHAGAVAVPAYPPDPARLARTLPRLEALICDARARFALTDAAIGSMAGALGQIGALAGLQWLSVEGATDEHAAAWRRPEPASGDVALLQYTSGSTGAPRGVMLTHANLLHNSAAIYRCFGHDDQSVGLIWLPPYHDMGLIGGILQPLYGGFPVALMSPLDFLARPARWVEAVSRYRATTSGGPNFAYELCARKVTPEQVAGLDLSSWRVAFNGAEPIDAGAIERFCRTFAPAGFRPEAMYPCYGLAEATLIATGGRPGGGAVVRSFSKDGLARGEAVAAEGGAEGASPARALVSCGPSLPGQEVLIVDPVSNSPLPEGRVGEIWVRGPSVAAGYWGRPEESAAALGARRADNGEGSHLRTGDLGFLIAGELFVTGRQKDLIIVRGRNHAPQDIERTATACDPALRPGCAAAFGTEVGGEERLVLVHEVDPRRLGDARAAVVAVRAAIAEEHGLHAHEVALIEPGSLPKTSSGKVQRRAAKAAYLSGQLAIVAGDVAPAAGPAPRLAPPPRLRTLPPGDREEQAGRWLLERASAALRLPAARLERRAPLVGLGLDSLRAVELKAEIEGAFDVSVPLSSLVGGASVDDLVRLCLLDAGGRAEAGGASATRREPAGQGSPCSYPQEEIWLAAQLDGGVGSYHIPAGVWLRGALRADWLEGALGDVVRRHEALRTCLPEVDGRPVQRVLPAPPSPLAFEDLADVADPGAWLREAAAAEARAPFDLARGPLYRARLVRLGADLHALLFTVHHAVADGWSMGLLLDEVSAAYAARARGEVPALPALPFSYADCAVWQRERLAGEHLERLLAHWKAELAGLPEEVRLPWDRAPDGARDASGGTLRAALPPAVAAALSAACARAQVTPFMWLLAVYAALLSRTTGQGDVPVGVAVLGRDRPGSEQLIGNFVNMVVLRARLSDDPPFGELLDRTRRATLGALAHQELPFELLVRAGLAERAARRKPLFRAAFGVQNQPRTQLRLPGVEAETLELDPGAVRLDLTLWVSDAPGGLSCVWTYAARLFDPGTVERLHRGFVALLERTLEDPRARVSTLPLTEDGPDVALGGALRRLDGARRRGAVRGAPGGHDDAPDRNPEETS